MREGYVPAGQGTSGTDGSMVGDKGVGSFSICWAMSSLAIVKR